MQPSAAHRLACVVAAAAIAAAAGAEDGVDAVPAAAAAAESDVTRVEAAFDVELGRPGETVVLRAQLRDASGRPADAPLRVQADGGTVEAPVRIGPGAYATRVTPPTVLGTRRVLFVIAAAGRGAASVVLPLAPGPAASLSVEAVGDVPADGAAHPLWVGVADAHGNPTSEEPRVEARRGSVSEPVPLASGGWMIPYRSPRDTRAGEDVVRIVAGHATTSTTLRLVPMRPTLSVDARGGVVFGVGDPAASLGGEVAVWRSAWGLDLGLVLAAGWWTSQSKQAVQGPGGSLELLSRRAWLPVTLSVASRLRLGGSAVATLSMGGGGALVTSRTTLAGARAVSELGWAPAAAASLELALRVRAGEPLVGVQGLWLGPPGLRTLRGEAWPVAVFLGYRFHAY